MKIALSLKEFALSRLPPRLVLVFLQRFVGLSDYKAKRESAKFFKLSNFAYGAGRIKKSDRLLSSALGLFGRSLPVSFSTLVRSCVRLTAKEPTQRLACSNKVFEATVALDDDAFDASGWYQLSRGLFCLGYCRSGWVAREKSLEHSIREGAKQIVYNTSVQRAIEAFLERRLFSSSIELLDRFASEIGTESRLQFLEYLGMMKNEYVPSLDRRPRSELDVIFNNLISGQTVAIVGPAAPTMELGTQVDSFDCVIRLKYAGIANLPNEVFYGSRCDINYYGNTEFISLNQHKFNQCEENFLKTPKINLSYNYFETNASDLKILNLRFNGPLYRTNATAGNRLLFGVINRIPKMIKLFGIDFYAGPTEYSKELLNFLNSNSSQLGHSRVIVKTMNNFESSYRSSGLLEHDPVSNFCFAQNLYKAGLFDIEPYGKSILELTPYQYVERLEEMLGDW